MKNIKKLSIQKGLITDTNTNGDLIIDLIKRSLRYLNVGYKDTCCNDTFCPSIAPCSSSSISLTADLPLTIDNNIISITEVDASNDGYLSASNYSLIMDNLSKWTLSGNDIFNNNSANVGIGTSIPAYKLDVNGTLRYNSDKLYNIYGLYIHGGGAAGSSSSTFLGRQAGNVNATGSDNNGIGKFALQSLTTGGANVAIGTSAGYGITTGIYNICLGRNSGVSSNGNYNILIGSKSSGQDNYTGSNNIALGYNMTAPNTAANDQLAIGFNGTYWLSYAGGNLGVGNGNPTTKLDVEGDKIRLRTAKTPASSTDSGNAGDICWDADYLYVCIATNTWKRSPITTW